MKKQMKWGLATLLLLLGIAAVFLFIDKDTETKPKTTLGQPTKDLFKQGVKLPQQAETPVAVEELPPVVPPNEHPSGPHQHGNGTVHNPSVSQVSQTYTGPLTYHEELLKTNPVKALRLQAEERGHWSAEHIPPFPPDDEEAASLAYNVYVQIHYEGINDPYNPVVIKAWKRQRAFMDTIFEKYPGLPPGLEKHSVKYTEAELAAQKTIDARRNDLGRLMWPQMESPPPSIHRWSSTFTK